MCTKLSEFNSEEMVVVVILAGSTIPHVFGSLAAIYDKFSAAQVGIALNRLYDLKLRNNDSAQTAHATIFKLPIYRKSQKK